MQKIEYRSYIQTRFLLGKTATEIHKELNLAYNENAPKYSTVAKWVALFKEGRESLEDNPRSGRPITVYTNENIDLVRNLIEEDPHLSCAELEAITSVNHYTLLEILHNALGMRKLTSRWIPHQLTAKNIQERVAACRENLRLIEEGKLRLCDIITGDESWFYLIPIWNKSTNASWVAQGEKPRTVVRQSRFSPKFLYYIFFRSTGLVHIGFVEKGKTMTSDCYITDCLEPVYLSMGRQRPKAGLAHMRLLHDNARPHVTKEVKSSLETQGVKLVRHPPYSPDLAPCDFWLFDYVKQRLNVHTDVESQKRQITSILRSIPKEEYKKTFDKWVERMQMCINNQGQYFEHLIK